MPNAPHFGSYHIQNEQQRPLWLALGHSMDPANMHRLAFSDARPRFHLLCAFPRSHDAGSDLCGRGTAGRGGPLAAPAMQKAK